MRWSWFSALALSVLSVAAIPAEAQQPEIAAQSQYGDAKTWGFLAKLAGRDYIACETWGGVKCEKTYSAPVAVREIPGGYAIHGKSGVTIYVTDQAGQPLIMSGGEISPLQLISSTSNEMVLKFQDSTFIYSEWEGVPTVTVVEENKVQRRQPWVDRSRHPKRYAKDFFRIHSAAGAPPISSPYRPVGAVSETLVALLGREAMPRSSNSSQASDDGSHARSVRKGLGGVFGGVVGMLAGAELTQGLGLTESIIATAASAAAGALVGSGEISPEDALAATTAVTDGMAQGYADAAAQNAQTAALISQARIADDLYRQQQMAHTQSAVESKAKADRDVITRVFAEAEAFRAVEMQKAIAAGDVARQTHIAQQSAAAMQSVQSFGLENQVRESARKIAEANQAAFPQQMVNTAARPQQPVTPYPNDTAAASVCIDPNMPVSYFARPELAHCNKTKAPNSGNAQIASNGAANPPVGNSTTGSQIQGPTTPDRYGNSVNIPNQGGGSSSPQMVTWMEGIAICDQATIGKWRCRGPRDSSSFYSSLESNLKEVCSNSRSLGTQNGYSIFGCGYGINPNENLPFREAHHFDWIRELNLSSPPGRRQFRCPSSQSNSCLSS